MKMIKYLCITLSTWLVVSALLTSIAQAQSVLDATPPVIELDETTEGIAGETQVFTARVTDDLGLRDVKLYYRFSGQEAYTDLLMQQLGNTGYFSANVPTEETETRSIEYYIQARDNGGNRVIKGFAFEPYVRFLVLPEPVQEPPEQDTDIANAVAVEPPAPSEPESSSKFKWWYLAVGVLVAGGLAAAASSGGDGGGTPSTPQTLVTISVPNP